LADCDRSYISQVETGRVMPGIRFLMAVARAFNVSTPEMLQLAGIFLPDPADEAYLAELVAARPKLAEVFEYAHLTGDTTLLADLERFAGMLLKERGIEHESSGGTPTEGSGDGNCTGRAGLLCMLLAFVPGLERSA
jgi:transcriptional regulator with XRE-family HTH domain